MDIVRRVAEVGRVTVVVAVDHSLLVVVHCFVVVAKVGLEVAPAFVSPSITAL